MCTVCCVQGMYRTKRKKQAKLKRVMTTVRKQARKGETGGAESFAALHLLHDPQAFAERIFSRLQVRMQVQAVDWWILNNCSQ